MTKPVDYRQFYRTPWGMAFISYLMAMGLVGALTPPDILTAYSWTRPFTDFMASIVSQIDKVTSLGIDADINRFFFSVMWASSPIVVFFVFFLVWTTRHSYLSDKTTVWRMPLAESIKHLFPALVLGVLGFCFFYFPLNTDSRILRGMLGAFIGRAIVMQSFVLGPVVFFSLIFFWFMGWLTGYIPRNIEKQNHLESTYGK